MRWSKVWGKFVKHAAITGGSVMAVEAAQALVQAGTVSGVNWLALVDSSVAAAVVAVIGGLVGGGINAAKHAGRAP